MRPDLRLPTIRARAQEMLTAGEKEQLTYRGFLAELSRRLRLRRQPVGEPGHDPHPGHLSLGAGWAPVVFDRDSGTGKSHLSDRPGHRRRRSRLPGQVHPGRETDERAGGGRRREGPHQDHRPLRPSRPALHRRARLHGSSTAAAPTSRSRSSPNARRRTASPSPATSPSPGGPRPSPTPASAPPSSTASPSAPTSSRPAPTPTDSPTPSPPRAVADWATGGAKPSPRRRAGARSAAG
jgi:hypothetical protein